jgi:hypothetical protein
VVKGGSEKWRDRDRVGTRLRVVREASIRTLFGLVGSRVHGGVQPVEVLPSH